MDKEKGREGNAKANIKVVVSVAACMWSIRCQQKRQGKIGRANGMILLR